MAESFGTYELMEQIGTGGMAEVYLAKSKGAEGLEKRLVIKRILPKYSRQDRFIDMFVDEATIAVNLNHPNIVQIYDFGKAEGDYYLAMEYVDGPNLAELIDAGMQAGRPMPLGEAVYVAIEVAKGLHYAHRRTDDRGDPLGIVHRDISPQNVLVSRDGAVKIVDFGIAKAASMADAEQSDEAGRTMVKGKHRYMSPEQAGGEDVDHRSDIFSLGVVLFELVCREPLFDRDTVDETLSMVKSAVVPDISELNPEVPEALESVLYRALAREPEERFQTARALKSELTDVLYEFDRVHDSMSLSDYIRNVGELDPSDIEEVDTDVQTRETEVTRSTTETTADGTRQVTVAQETDIQTESVSDDAGETAVVAPTRQRKEVVVLVGELSGIMRLKQNIDENHLWVQVMEEYTRIVDSIAFKNNGLVHHVDESGFLVVLGLPISSQNDSLRGVRVARDLQEAISGMNLSLDAPIELSVGVAIGQVIVDQSDDEAFDWSFYGDAYEKAEQVAGEAMPGEVLTSSQVYRRVEREFEFEEVDLDEATGTGDAAYKLAGPRPREERIEAVRRSYRSFYGREIPLKMLRDRYRQTRLEDEVAGVMLMGEPGVGKSTVIEEFLDGLDGREVRIVRAMISPFDRDVPMGPLANLFRDLMRLDGDADVRTQQSTLQTRLEALFPDIEQAESELLEESLAYLFDIPAGGRSFGDLSAEERQRRTFLSLRRVLRQFAERKPIVVAVDDVHHLDSVSLEFFEQLFEEEPLGFSAFWVMGAEFRGWHAGEEARDRLAGREQLSVERMGELSRDDATSLVEDLLRGQGVRNLEIAEDIYELSGGNPLFIKEVVGILRDRGILDDPAAWRDIENTDERPSWLPTSVEGFISARIDRLEPATKDGLQRLSLLWNPFTREEASLVLEDTEEDKRLDQIFEDLVSAEFLEPVDGAGDGRGGGEANPSAAESYRFCDELTQEVARRTLVPDKRVGLHERLVAYLKQRDEETDSLEQTVKLARHLDGAGRTEEAIEYYLRAGEEALDQQGASESVRLTDEVLEEVDLGSEEAVRALDIRRRAWTMLGEMDRASNAIEGLLEAGEPEVALPKRVRMLLLQARFQRQQEHYERAETLSDEARALAEEGGDALSMGPVLYHEASRAVREGRLSDALEAIEEAIEMLQSEESAEARRQLANCLNMQGVIHRRLGRQRQALDHYEEAIELARDLQESQLTRHLLNNSGLALAYLGRYMEALERYREALEEARRLGSRRFQAEYLINIGHARYLLGTYDEAASMIRRGIYQARKSEVPEDIANGLVSLGLVYAAQGELESAEETLHEGLRRADSIPDAFVSAYATFSLAEVHLSRGNDRAARTAAMQAEDGLERVRDAGMRWGEPIGLMLLARAHDARGDQQRAVELAQQAVEALEGVDIHDAPEVLYHYVQILPDGDEHRRERREAIEEAKALVEERAERIEDDELRQSYLRREIPNAVLNVATLLDQEVDEEQ